MHKNKIVLKDVFQNNKKQILIICGALIVLCLLCGNDLITSANEVENDVMDEIAALEKELEKKLEDFLQTVDGVGKTKVCIMFDVLEETSYAVNVESETDESIMEYVIIENTDGSEYGLPLSIRAPQIRGIAVSCAGGASAKVKNEVTALLTASLGIPANRVHVAQYADHAN